MGMQSCAAEVILLIAECLKTKDLLAFQQTCQFNRAVLTAKMWQTIEIQTTMEDETVGLTLIGREGHVQVGNKNVDLFLKEVETGHFDYILPHVKRLKVVEETPYVLREEVEQLPLERDFDTMETRQLFACLFDTLLSRKTLPRLDTIFLDRVVVEEPAGAAETALNHLIAARHPDIKVEFDMHPSYGFNWFANDDRFLFDKLTNIECYTMTDDRDASGDEVFMFDFTLPRSLKKFSMQNNITIDTEEFKKLFKHCTQLETLELDIARVQYSESINWIPESVTELFIHVSDEDTATTGLKQITAPSVESLALDGHFWTVLATLNFPSLKDLDLNVMVGEDGVPQATFCRSVANVLKWSKLDSVVVNFSIEALPLMIKEYTASTVKRIRACNSWRRHYDRTFRLTELGSMKDVVAHFPHLETFEVTMGGLKSEGQLDYILNTACKVLKSKPGITVRFLSADTQSIEASDDLFVFSTIFTEYQKTYSSILELDRAKIKSVYTLGRLETFRKLLRHRPELTTDMIELVELVLEGR